VPDQGVLQAEGGSIRSGNVGRRNKNCALIWATGEFPDKRRRPPDGRLLMRRTITLIRAFLGRLVAVLCHEQTPQATVAKGSTPCR